MKIKRTAPLIFTLLFVLLIAFFLVFGRELRELCSPKVTYTSLRSMEIDGQLYSFVLPAEAVHRDDGGEAYVWAILEDAVYGEQRDAVHKCIVQVMRESDQYTAIATMQEILYDADIAVDYDRELEENRQVVVVGRAETEKEEQSNEKEN